MRPDASAFKYALWTSGGIPTAAMLSALYGVVAVEGHDRWRGDAMWALQDMGGVVVLVVPAILALLAVPPAMAGPDSIERAMLPTRPVRSHVLRASADVAPLAAVQLVLVIAVLTWTVQHGARVATDVVVLAVTQTLVVTLLAVLGRAIGDASRHPIGVLAAIAIGVGIAAFGADALRLSAGSSPYAGLSLPTGDYLLTAATAVVLTGALIGTAPMLRAGWWRVGVCVAAIVTASQVFGPTQLRSANEDPEECDRAAELTVCVYSGYEFMLPAALPELEAGLSVLERSGVDPGLRGAEQDVPLHSVKPGMVALHFDVADLDSESVRPTAMRSSILHPAWCARLSDPEPLPTTFDDRQRLAFWWFELQAGAITSQDFEARAPELAALSPSAQRDFVQRFLDENLDCSSLE